MDRPAARLRYAPGAASSRPTRPMSKSPTPWRSTSVSGLGLSNAVSAADASSVTRAWRANNLVQPTCESLRKPNALAGIASNSDRPLCSVAFNETDTCGITVRVRRPAQAIRVLASRFRWPSTSERPPGADRVIVRTLSPGRDGDGFGSTVVCALPSSTPATCVIHSDRGSVPVQGPLFIGECRSLLASRNWPRIASNIPHFGCVFLGR